MASPGKTRVTPTCVRHARRSSLLALLGVALLLIPMPYSALSLLLLGGAAYESIQAIRTANVPAARSTRISSIVGLVLVGVLALLVAAPYAFYDQSSSYQRCREAANTNIAMARCTSGVTNNLPTLFRTH